MKLYPVVFLCLFWTIGCRQVTPLEQALQMAGENRTELEKVLTFYQNDDLKYRAATFLIENMIYHQYREGEWIDVYNAYFELYGTGRYTPREVDEKVKREKGELNIKKWVTKKDIQEVDSAYLVQNIEWAFKVWEEQPWGKNITFENFCEQILPYRSGNETLSVWREELYERYNPQLDDFRSGPEATDPLQAARKMIEILAEENTYWTTGLPQGPHVGSQLVNWRCGTCRELSDLVIFVLRALGIPCGMDYFHLYSDSNDGHLWVYMPDKDGQIHICDFPGTQLRPATYLNMRKSKVYRKRFGLNQEVATRMGKSTVARHPVFGVPLFEDVTALYKDRPQIDLTIPVSSLNYKLPASEMIYLCNSKYIDWVPVAWSKRTGGSVCFKDVEPGGVFVLAVWQDNRLQFITEPFYSEPGGEVRFLCTGEPEDITVFCKDMAKESFVPRMAGGAFEGSNDSDFINRDTLYVIPEPPVRLYTEVCVSVEKEYRYVRYYGPPDSHCNIAEMVFYTGSDGDTLLQGRVIGTPGSYHADGSHEHWHALDGNPYTSFDYKEHSEGWVGVDFGAPRQVTRLVYAPRNRDNFIRVDDRYELFYFKDQQWCSLGQQVAVSDSLVFRGPAGALYYLRNHTRGKDERIFEYINRKQIFR